MPWTTYVSEFLDKNFPSEKEGIADRSELVDEYFGQMFQSYAKTCISYTLTSAAVRKKDKINSNDLLTSINSLFPLDDKEVESDNDKNNVNNNKIHGKSIINRNLSKDRRSSKANTGSKTPVYNLNGRNSTQKDRILNNFGLRLPRNNHNFKVKPSKDVPLNVAFELEN